jgi:hypothetical protein
MADDLHQPRPDENPALAAAIRDGAAGVDEHEAHVHIVPPWILLSVFAALLFLTFVTVAVTWVDFGRAANVWIALTIAALFFVALLIGIIVLDTSEYHVNFSTPPPTSARPAQ